MHTVQQMSIITHWHDSREWAKPTGKDAEFNHAFRETVAIKSQSGKKIAKAVGEGATGRWDWRGGGMSQFHLWKVAWVPLLEHLGGQAICSLGGTTVPTLCPASHLSEQQG